MSKHGHLLIDVIIIAAVITTAIFVYRNYFPDFWDTIVQTDKASIYVRDIPVFVTVADNPAKREKGLGGVEELKDNEGMLFVFDATADHRFWMKDTLIPLDIFWLDEKGIIIHIEKNVGPETYPATYGALKPSRFVLETNAFFADTFKIVVGDRVTIPADRLPADLRQ